MLDNYYLRFDPEKNYDEILFLPGKGLQSAELNDLQAQVGHHTRAIADSILSDGDIVSGGDIAIDTETGKAKISAAAVYIQGKVRQLKEQELQIPTDRVLYIGVWLTEKVVTELEDPALRDPAVGTRNYHEPGAARRQKLPKWGLKDDPSTGVFFPVYRIDNGVHIQKQAPPQLDAVSVAIARYDRESKGGNYVVRGMEVTALNVPGTDQVFSIQEGLVHIDGFAIAFATAMRKIWPFDPDSREVRSEPHTFTGVNGRMRIDLSFSPVSQIKEVFASFSVTKSLTHGLSTGSKDLLPDPAVLKLVKVSQGQTNYIEGTDFRLFANQVDWSLNGNEPAPGSTYSVIYEYRKAAVPIQVDEHGFSLEGVLQGSVVDVDYEWYMPRIDIITLDKTGEFRRIKGLAAARHPFAPQVPNGQFLLAEVNQAWRPGKVPKIVNNMVRAVPMQTLTRMQEQIDNLFALVASERLKTNANASEPGTKKGVFVDPFLDNDMRDHGYVQNAQILNGELTLPIDEEILDLENASNPAALNVSLETVLNQPMHTGSMKVNPYQAFDPIPPKVTLDPSVDNGSRTDDIFPSNNFGQFTLANTVIVDSVTTQLRFLRERSVKFEIEDFGPGEELVKVVFDGVNVYEGGQPI